MGEVAKVGHLTMAEAQEIVRLGNELYNALVQAKLAWVGRELERLSAKISAAKHSCPACGEMTRDSTAGCDKCDLEDK